MRRDGHSAARPAAVAWLILAAALLTPPPATAPEAAATPGAPAPVRTPDLGRERRLAQRVARDRALAAVRALVETGPRMGGTASGDRAAGMIASWMREAGLGVEVIDDPPRRVHEESSWVVQLPSGKLPSAWPWGFSPSLPRGSFGVALDEALPAGGDSGRATPLAGRVLLTSRSPAGVLARAARAGAAAILTDGGTDPNTYVDAAPIHELRGGGVTPSLPVFGLSYRDGRALRQALAADPDVQVVVSLEAGVREGRPRTVLATLAGAGPRRDEIILVCAHGDSDAGGPGADDNASGEAALLEVARALSGAAAEGILPADRPAVRFAIWGSEIHSSRAYAGARAEQLPRHIAVFNFDQAGFGAARDALYYEGNDIPWNAPLLRTLEAIGRDHAGQPGFWDAHTSNPSLGGTDMYVFLPREFRGMGTVREKIPVTTVFTAAWDRPTVLPQTPGWQSPGWNEPGALFIDYSPVYHSSGDVPERTTEREPFNMERCARMVLLAILRLMDGTAVTGGSVPSSAAPGAGAEGIAPD